MYWGLFPPEVNSAKMYTGPGATSLLAAASSWTALSVALHEMASGLSTTWSTLMATWSGPSSLAASRAALAYHTWTIQTASQAEQTAEAATLAAAAYEQAYAMTVPPPVITANRALLAMLVTTNFLGINTPAIMETEAHYAEMWAQDAEAMFGYQVQSQAATNQLRPLAPAPEVAKPTAAVNSSIGQGAVQAAVSNGGSPTDILSDPLVQTLNGYGQNLLSSGFWNPTNFVGLFTSGHDYFPGQDPDVLAPTPRNIFSEPQAVAAGVAPPQTATAEAAIGRASRIGSLSVPTSWAVQTDKVELASAAAPLTSSEGVPGAAGMPGMYGAPGANRPFNTQPKYGKRLTIVPRPPAGG